MCSWIKIKNVGLLLMLVISPLLAFGQIYHAGEDSHTASTKPNWEISAGWVRSNMSVYGHYSDRLLSNETGVSARALYYVAPWLAVGPEGIWFSSKSFPTSNRFQNTRYGGVLKFILTPQTQPAAYLLAGGGSSKREMSYAGGMKKTSSNSAYALVGAGAEVTIAYGLFVAAEVQGIYNAKKKIDGLSMLKHSWETIFSLRGGIRF